MPLINLVWISKLNFYNFLIIIKDKNEVITKIFQPSVPNKAEGDRHLWRRCFAQSPWLVLLPTHRLLRRVTDLHRFQRNDLGDMFRLLELLSLLNSERVVNDSLHGWLAVRSGFWCVQTHHFLQDITHLLHFQLGVSWQRFIFRIQSLLSVQNNRRHSWTEGHS